MTTPHIEGRTLRRVVIAMTAWVTYVAAYGGLHQLLGIHTGVMAFVPVLLTGWLWGGVAGLIAGITAIPLTVMLSSVFGPTVASLWSLGALLGAGAMALSGFAVGRMRDLASRAREDADDRRHIEARLRESEEKFRVLTEESDINISMVRDGRIVYANAAMQRMTGYSRDELYQIPFQDLVHPDSRDVAEQQAARRFEGERLKSPLELKIAMKSGDHRWIAFQGSTIEVDGKPTLLSTGVDVTLARQAEEMIFESESRLRSVLDQSVDGIAVVVGDKLEYVNPTLCEMFGYTAKEFLETEPGQFLTESDRDRARQQLRSRSTTGISVLDTAEFEAERKNGTRFTLESVTRRIQYRRARRIVEQRAGHHETQAGGALYPRGRSQVSQPGRELPRRGLHHPRPPLCLRQRHVGADVRLYAGRDACLAELPDVGA